MNVPLRVLFVVTTLDVGGAEKHLLWLGRGLVDRGHGFDVVYLKGGGRLRPEFEALGARVDKIPFESPFQLFSTAFALASRIRNGAYDVVHSHLLKADALSALAARLARPRAYVQSKHNEEQVLKKWAVGIVHGMLSRVPDRVIALSDHVLEFIATAGRTPRDRLVRVYYGIDVERFRHGDREATRAALGLAPTTSVGLCAARFHPQKDHPTLLRAARRLKDAGRDFHLLLAGGDPFYDFGVQVEALARELDLQDRVSFLGIRDDVPDLLAACDLFVLPSIFEGLGLVFLEAMAAERPVLSTNSTAIPEVVIDGETGALVEVGDAAALAATWEGWIDDPERARALGAAGARRVAETFTLPRMIDETLAVYRAAAPRAGKNSARWPPG